jgi:hypothetical protein
MTLWLLATLTTIATGFEAEKDGIVLRVDVAGNKYSWTVENKSSVQITGFDVDVYHCYNYLAPDKWEYDGPKPTGTFRSWTDDPRQAIKRGQSGSFSTRLNNRGAMLGVGSATVRLGNGDIVVFSDVWQPVAESKVTVYTIPITIGVLATLHTFGVLILRRRQQSNDA